MTRFHGSAGYSVGLAALAVAAGSWSCAPAGTESPRPQPGQEQVIPIPPFAAPPMAVAPTDPEGERGLVFRLEGAPGREVTTPRDPASPSTRLGTWDTDRLLARLHAAADEPDTAASPFPPASPPPPRTGATLLARFPPPDSVAPPTPAESTPMPLEVLRVRPTGETELAPHLSVRVRVSMIAPSVRYHVALMDPLPAGLEPLNPELRGAGFDDDPTPPGDPGVRIAPPWRTRWFEHQNLRNDRAEAFASRLPAGVYEYTYLARATALGTFLAAPPRAEEMYSPETFGRDAAERVIIE